ncbi:MAG: hypothetical protein ACTS85_04410 [Arsenophonus sp. NC-PG7-MAG3]
MAVNFFFNMNKYQSYIPYLMKSDQLKLQMGSSHHILHNIKNISEISLPKTTPLLCLLDIKEYLCL